MSKKMNLIERFYQEVFGFLKRLRRFRKGGALPHFRGVVCLLAFVICHLTFVISASQAAFPPEINYQGKLTNASNIPVADGNYSIIFSIYSVSSGGSDLWNETQTVTTESGFFNVILGSIKPIGTNVFDGNDRWLGIKVGSDSEMTPRQKLTAVGHAFYAYNADQLDGHQWSEVPTGGNYVLKAGDTMTGNLTMSASSINLASGTYSLPSLSFAAAPTLGFYYPASNYFRAVSGGTVCAEFGPNYIAANTIFPYTTTAGLQFYGMASDGAAAKANKFGNYWSLTASGAKIASFYSDQFTTEKAYLDKDGTFSTGGLVRAVSLESTVADGTAPLTVASTTKVTYLNADLLDGNDSSAFATASDLAGYVQLGPTTQQTTAGATAVWVKGATNGVSAEGADYGVWARSDTTAVYGEIDASNYGALGKYYKMGQYYGVYGESSTVYGVYGKFDDYNYGYIGSSGTGVYGQGASNGIWGTDGINNGYLGRLDYNAGVWGQGSTYGVYGTDNSTKHYGYLGSTLEGVSAYANDASGYALRAEQADASGYAIYALGKVTANNTIETTAGGYKFPDGTTQTTAYTGTTGDYVLKAGDTMTGVLTMSATRINNADGSVSLPSYSFSSDNDTGIYRSAADTLDFTVNGTRIFNANTDGLNLWYGSLNSNTIQTRTATTLSLYGAVANGASAVGTIIDNSTALTTSGAKLLSIRNANTEKAYIDKNGTIVSSGLVRAVSLESTVATGTAPLTVASTTKVTNLNADLLDDKHASEILGDYVLKAGDTMTGTLTNTAGTSSIGINVVNNQTTTANNLYGVYSSVQLDDSTYTNNQYGGYFVAGGGGGMLDSIGVYGVSNASGYDSYSFGVYGSGPIGVKGEYNDTHLGCLGGSSYGVFGAINDASGYAVLAYQADASGYAIYANGGKNYFAGNVGIGTMDPGATLEVSGNVKATKYESTVATGTAPLTVASTTKVANLNADLLDDKHASDFAAVSPSGDYVQLGPSSIQTTASDKAVWVSGNLTGVHGEGTNYGVFGMNGSNYGYLGGGIYGAYGRGTVGIWGANVSDGNKSGYIGGSDYGVYGQYSATNYGYLGSANYGVYGSNGTNSGGLGGTYGAYGNSAAGYGVRGNSETGYGVGGFLSGTSGRAVWGSAYNGSGTETYGGYFNSAGTIGTGVVGENTAGSGTNYGVYGIVTSTDGWGGYFTGGRGLYTSRILAGPLIAEPSTTWEAYVNGDMKVTGVMSKGSGTFLIDHPADPKNKILRHGFVESPDHKNIYDGIAVLDENGEAAVSLPAYFEALNKDYRYQLTTLGGYAPVFIKKEIVNNRFVIAGGQPGTKVSWQVTGIRQDAFALEHPVVVEEEKGESGEFIKGQYLHPEAFEKHPELKEGRKISMLNQ